VRRDVGWRKGHGAPVVADRDISLAQKREDMANAYLGDDADRVVFERRPVLRKGVVGAVKDEIEFTKPDVAIDIARLVCQRLFVMADGLLMVANQAKKMAEILVGCDVAGA
jgi:hypothetical protein